VGVLTAAGGTGKTFLLLTLALTGAAGGNFGPIKALSKLKTLVIVGEDPQDELVRRAWDICKGQFPANFHAVSVYGEIGPLLRIEHGSPIVTDSYQWLKSTLEKHPGLNLLILDPKSRFYGLDENSNEHATIFIQCLEALAKRYGLTILFSHHTGKENSSKLEQNMSRGASALVDGCRWQAGLVRMDPKTADRLGVDKPRDYVLFDTPKSNYSPDLPGELIFKRGENGVLEYAEPGQEHLEKMGKALLGLLNSDTEKYTKSELLKAPRGKGVADDMKEQFPKFTRTKDMDRTIQYLLKKGMLRAEITNPGRNAKEILIVAGFDGC